MLIYFRAVMVPWSPGKQVHTCNAAHKTNATPRHNLGNTGGLFDSSNCCANPSGGPNSLPFDISPPNMDGPIKFIAPELPEETLLAVGIQSMYLSSSLTWISGFYRFCVLSLYRRSITKHLPNSISFLLWSIASLNWRSPRQLPFHLWLTHLAAMKYVLSYFIPL